MKPVQGITAVIIRIWAAGIIVTFLGSLPFYISGAMSSEQGADSRYAAFIVNNAIWLTIAILAWIGAPSLTKLIYPAQNEDTWNISIDADTIVMIGSFLIGGFYLVQHVPSLLTQVGGMFIENSHQDPSVPYELGRLRMNSISVRQLFTDVLIVIAALWMTFRPSQVAYIFSHLRQAGLYKDKAQPTFKTQQ